MCSLTPFNNTAAPVHTLCSPGSCSEPAHLQELVTFRATGRTGSPIYHTNVMMAIGSTCAIVCAESVEDPTERQRLLASLAKSHKARHA